MQLRTVTLSLMSKNRTNLAHEPASTTVSVDTEQLCTLRF